MKRIFLLVYQIGVACSDTLTGASLIIAPAFTLRSMGIVIDDASLVYIRYIGAFVLGVGLSCAYGALVLILRGALAPGWSGVAVFDGFCALIQGIGLWQEWLNNGTC